MLSSGKLGVGHHAYYELSVATGREYYYTGRGEARGWYLGAGSQALGLDGEVAYGDLAHLFVGARPQTGKRWSSRRPHDGKPRTFRMNDGRVIEGRPSKSTAAFDLTFSAPKSVSVLMGLGDRAIRTEIREGHEAAVRAAFDYLGAAQRADEAPRGRLVSRRRESAPGDRRGGARAAKPVQ